jgi:hypothetical protein
MTEAVIRGCERFDVGNLSHFNAKKPVDRLCQVDADVDPTRGLEPRPDVPKGLDRFLQMLKKAEQDDVVKGLRRKNGFFNAARDHLGQAIHLPEAALYALTDGSVGVQAGQLIEERRQAQRDVSRPDPDLKHPRVAAGAQAYVMIQALDQELGSNQRLGLFFDCRIVKIIEHPDESPCRGVRSLG